MTIAEKIEDFISGCSFFDELPHSFDDTLIDKLIGAVEFDDETSELIENLVVHTEFEIKSVPLQLIIRLLDVAVQNGAFRNEEALLEFVTSSETLLEQNRPARLIYDLFTLYSNPKIFNLRKADLWLDVIRWSLSQIDESATSIFVKRQIGKFLCSLSSLNARKLMVLSGVVQIFKRKISDAQITNVTTSILDLYAADLAPEECISIVDFVMSSTTRLGENTLKLLGKLKMTHPSLKVAFEPAKWGNESNRVDFVAFQLQSNSLSLSPQEAHEGIDLILASPAVRIHHHIAIFHQLSPKQTEEFVQNMGNQMAVRKFVNFKDLADLLPKLKESGVSLDHICFLVSCLGERILQNGTIFHALHEVFGAGIFEAPEFSAYKHRLQKMIFDAFGQEEWEILDTALEAAWLFPCFLPKRDVLDGIVGRNMELPYVLSTSMRILRDHFGGIPLELAESIVVKSPDPLPRLVAMQYLTTLDVFPLLSIDSISTLIYTCFSDIGIELRKEALKMAKLAVRDEKMKERISTELKQWLQDRDIGAEVAEIIGGSAESSDEGTMHLLEEMLNALKVHRNEEDTMDCY